MKPKLDLQGKTFNFLTVIKRDKTYPNTSGVMWKCKCICGKYRSVSASHISNDRIRSCGCMAFKDRQHGNKKYNEQEASFRAKASNYKAHAKRRKIIWELSMTDCVDLLKSRCFYCNSEPSNSYNVVSQNRQVKGKIYHNTENTEKYAIKFNGIDRKNNDAGYTLNNCVSCCQKCNTAKLNMSMEEFKKWIEKIIANYKNWKHR